MLHGHKVAEQKVMGMYVFEADGFNSVFRAVAGFSIHFKPVLLKLSGRKMLLKQKIEHKE